jgi:eukaryotic-like serine/threonine-protein kinase
MSDDGSLLYLPASRSRPVTPVWVDRHGVTKVVDPGWRLPSGPSQYKKLALALGNQSLALSSDGKRVAIALDSAGWNVWIKGLDGGPMTELTHGKRAALRPSWSADGKTVYFLSNERGNNDLWSQPADGSRGPTLVLDRPTAIMEAFRAPDGSIVFSTRAGSPADRTDSIFRVGPPPDTTVTPLVASPFWDSQATVSPDGRWLAYVSNESGNDQVYVRPFPNTMTHRWAVSVGGGTEPVWSRDGSELFYRGPKSYWAAEVKTSPTFSVSGWTALFAADPFAAGNGHPMYGVTPDGKRFFMLQMEDQSQSALILVRNWASEVAAKVGK